MHVAREQDGGQAMPSSGVGDSDPKPFLYRIHDVPDPSRLKELATFVKQFGFTLDVHSGVTPRALQKLLDSAQGVGSGEPDQ